MTTERKVAVVTGSNKGIGYAIVRGLCKQFEGDVFLTARNEDLGMKAVKDLKGEGFTAKFHQLDITDRKSIERLKNFLKSAYSGIDILVNNAGMAFKSSSTAPFSEQAEVTIKTNFTGTLDVSEALFPLLRPHARVVNVSSFVTRIAYRKCSPEMKVRFTDQNITKEQLTELMQMFVDEAQTGNHVNKGFPNSAYGMSKLGVTVLTQIQNRELAADPRDDVIVNACCPGYVDTDMTSHKGGKPIDEGADTPVYLALLPAGTTKPAGDFVSDRQIKNWAEEE